MDAIKKPGGPSDKWLRIWAFSRVALGLSEVEFWSLEPRRWHALVSEWNAQQRLLDHRVAVLCTVIANKGLPKGARCLKVSDFMPGDEPKEEPKQSAEQMLEMAKMFTARECGKAVRN
jgi:hypothetical protein